MAALSAGAAVGCGKKGPPLPPLVRLPSAPAAIEAVRRSGAVDVQFVVPSANTDGSRPANIERVDVYALDGAGGAPAAEADVLKAGTRVGTVAVKAPRDPDATIDPDEPDEDLEPLRGSGLDQGAPGHVRELLPDAAVAAPEANTRTYVSVGISTRGRRGPASKAAAVLLGAAPETPATPTVTYTETAVTITWEPVATETGTMSYQVYDVSPRGPNPDGSPRPAEIRLTDAPIADQSFTDTRIEWNVDRCYTVRAVRRLNALGVEGDAAPARCERLVDTFPPAPPTGLTAVASEGEISLIWTPNTEADLAGYRVLRAAPPSTELLPITAESLAESTYTDSVPADTRYVYAVVAIDTAGNASAPSERVEETAR